MQFYFLKNKDGWIAKTLDQDSHTCWACGHFWNFENRECAPAQNGQSEKDCNNVLWSVRSRSCKSAILLLWSAVWGPLAPTKVEKRQYCLFSFREASKHQEGHLWASGTTLGINGLDTTHKHFLASDNPHDTLLFKL